MALRNRIGGSIYGLMIGDALGCPVEGCRPEEIIEQFGRITQMETPKVQRYRPKGLHSDDGQQAMALCDAILRAPESISREYARNLVELYRAPLPVSKKLSFFFGLHRGHGKNFRATVKALDAGACHTESGQASSGNGSAMLIAPLGIYLRDAESHLLAEAVVSVARVKTLDVRGIAAASAVAFVVKHFVNFGDHWTRDVETALIDFVRDTEKSVAEPADPNRDTLSEALWTMLQERDRDRRVVLDGISARASTSANRPVGPTLGYAVASVITSIYISVTTSSFRDGVEDIIALGGDTDTTAAMVGAMAGARFGFSSIPKDWYAELHARGAFDDRIDGLTDRRPGWQPETKLVDLETEWCRLYEAPEALARYDDDQRRRAERRRQKNTGVP